MPDAGIISMAEHLAATSEINRASRLPVVADVDDGFGDVVNVVRVVQEYEAAGVAAICLEDNQQPKRNSLTEGLGRALVELHLAIGYYIMTSKFLTTFDIDLQTV